jgi:DNA-binding CsgD family transcriptional regulator
VPFRNYECADCGHLALQHAAGGGPCALCTKCKELVCPFSAREFQILKLIIKVGAKGAAQALNLSIKTIEAHRFNMLAKAHAHTTLELILVLFRSGALKLADFPDSGVRVCVRAPSGMIESGNLPGMKNTVALPMDRTQLEQRRKAAATAGYPLEGDSGATEIATPFGKVGLAFRFDEAAEVLLVTVTHHPFMEPESAIEGKIRSLFAGN